MKSSTIKQQKLNLYDLLFHFNDFTSKWNCFQRVDSKHYFNGTKCKKGQGEDIIEAYKNYKDE